MPGRAYAIEPGVYYLGDHGFRSEINVLITEQGKVEVTTPPQKRLARI
jgi:Xaa-Pro aminopeptidase